MICAPTAPTPTTIDDVKNITADVENAAPHKPTIIPAMQHKINRRFSTRSASDTSNSKPRA